MILRPSRLRLQLQPLAALEHGHLLIQILPKAGVLLQAVGYWRNFKATIGNPKANACELESALVDGIEAQLIKIVEKPGSSRPPKNAKSVRTRDLAAKIGLSADYGVIF